MRLLRSYEKQISINAMKKMGAPLLGLAEYIYYMTVNFKAATVVGTSHRGGKTVKRTRLTSCENMFCVPVSSRVDSIDGILQTQGRKILKSKRNIL